MLSEVFVHVRCVMWREYASSVDGVDGMGSMGSMVGTGGVVAIVGMEGVSSTGNVDSVVSVIGGGCVTRPWQALLRQVLLLPPPKVRILISSVCTWNKQYTLEQTFMGFQVDGRSSNDHCVRLADDQLSPRLH
jgi:hypothetical protein